MHHGPAQLQRRPKPPAVARAGGWIALALLSACHGTALRERARGVAPHGHADVGGQVVSTVDGHPIVLSEVRELVAAGLSPKQALSRLQSERVLAEEAARRGVQSRYAVVEVEEKAAVQALLADEVSRVTIADSEIAAEYDKQRARFEQSERRAAVHFLAHAPADASPSADAAARALVERVLPELEAASDVDAFVAKYHKTLIDGIAVTAERVRPTPRNGRLVEPFLAAMYSIPGPGTVPSPVRTRFGWHAIRVTAVIPPQVTPREQAYATLRAELELKHKQERVAALVERLRSAYPVALAQDVGHMLGELPR